mgnify:CR=1 FL=1
MKHAGDWNFAGSCIPGENNKCTLFTNNTFSVGIFQWKQGKTKLIKSRVVSRVMGYSIQKENVLSIAKILINNLNSGELDPKKLKKCYKTENWL